MTAWIRDVERVFDCAYRLAKSKERDGFPSVELAQGAADARAGLRKMRKLISQRGGAVDSDLAAKTSQDVWRSTSKIVALAINS
jgi:hypothetical protein